MALTQTDLQAIRGVVDESIAHHPRFDELEVKIDMMADDILEVMAEGFTMVSEKFEEVDRRFEEVDRQFDELRSDVAGLKVDIVELKVDVGDLKTDLRVVTHMAKDHSFRLARVEHKNGLI